MHAPACEAPEIITPRERSQAQKTTQHLILFVWTMQEKAHHESRKMEGP